jgi:hypothetical protein
MGYYENMIEKFPCDRFVVGYGNSGHIMVVDNKNASARYFAFATAIECVQNPMSFSAMVARALGGDITAIGHYEGVNVGALTITGTGVKAELDLPDDEYEDELTFEEFSPLLDSWEQAWTAAQLYKKALAQA